MEKAVPGQPATRVKYWLSLSWVRRARWMVLAVILLGSWEMHSSTMQALYLANWASDMRYEMHDGPSRNNRYPQTGPFDQRLGYTQVAQWSDHLASRGYEVTQQAQQSQALRNFLGQGFFAPNGDKNQAGLELLDCRGESFFKANFPRQVYVSVADVPVLVAQTLAFIENKELLAPAARWSNPALEWKRLGRALLERTVLLADDESSASGGSTLATQLEKFRHSPQGRTASVGDKYRQMVSASVRAYQGGMDTQLARDRILLDYLNGLPLGARRGHGEVNGLLDGLRLWWGADPDSVNRVLRDIDTDRSGETSVAIQARAYRQVLSLLIALRRPSHYLGQGQERLSRLTDSYLRLLAQAGVIAPDLRDAALQTQLTAQIGLVEPPRVERKAASAVRIELASLLQIPRLYDVDRLDLSATTTLDATLQNTVAATLRRLGDPVVARRFGLVGDHLLGPEQDPSQLFYSFTLFESKGGVNRLRVQTDNLDQPFDINTGAKLELGSTAKLRTLISYLEIVARLHHQLADLQPADLVWHEAPARDRLAQWAVQYLRQASDKNLKTMLEAAMQRRYSAHPGEAFFTGGGLHTFANYDRIDDGREPTVAEAFRDSVNLVFIRVMRDVVNHTLVRTGRPVDAILADLKHPERAVLLSRFGEEESSRLLRTYYRTHQGQTTEQLDAFLAPSQSRTRPHLLELWLVKQLREQATISLAQLMQSSREQRRASYDWLLRLRNREAQNSRIIALLEREAFVEIHQGWKRLAYPFDRLVPSYASAIGSAGDRPAALAELMGIIVNQGLRQPLVHLEELRFAGSTPYETVIRRQAARPPERVMASEVAAVLRQALSQVVELGTARRLRGVLKESSGTLLAVGGKTGTGDNRLESYGAGGALIGSRAINRTATFVFFLGQNHFGSMTAYVSGTNAQNYHFTSALPVQIVKSLAPLLAAVSRAPQAGALDEGCVAH